MKKLVWVLFAAALVAVGFTSKQSQQKSEQNSSEQATESTVEATADQVWISRADGAKSCGDDKGQSLDLAEKDLEKVGVKVIQSKKARDGKMHMQMCGAPTGSENAHLISKKDLKKAEALGFKAMKSGS